MPKAAIKPEKLKAYKLKLKGRRTELTDKEVRALLPAPTGSRYEINDPGLAKFAVRVNDRGQGTYILVARFPGHKQPARREIAKVGEVSLAEARETASEWIALIKRGVDPKHEVERQKQAKLRKQAVTFASVAELWLKKHAAKLRTFKSIERMVQVELIGTTKDPRLGHRPIAEIAKGEVKDLLNAIIDSGRTRTAHLVFEYLRGVYTWAEDQEDYGLEASPTDKIKPKAMFGERVVRTHVLSDDEVKSFWAATGRMGYPHGPLFRLLLLTGARLREIGGASWREINPDNWREIDHKKLVADLRKVDAKLTDPQAFAKVSTIKLTVPSERFKSNAEHLVPLSSMALALLKELPTFASGDYIFTVTGERPVESFASAKRRLDRLMAEEPGYEPAPFVLHDLRRTVRTKLSALKVPHNVAEIIIGHGKKGLDRVYDQHRYEPEMREGLELWANRLRDIVTPPPPNVVQFGERVGA
jgi:integrase